MFLPIGDDQDHERRPVVTWILIAANLIVFALFCLPHPRPGVVDAAAFVPSQMRPLSIFSSMFLHYDLFHLAGNMLFLWLFGRLVEERIGPVAYALFYPVCGIAAAFLHAYGTEHPQAPAYGASGGVSGVVGAALLLAPRAQIKVFVWFIWWGIYEIPAAVWIALWFAEQVFFSSREYGNVAYYAHLGGFAAGAGTAWVLRFAASVARRRVPPLESRDLAAPRRPFVEVRTEAPPVFLDPSVDSYAVVTLEDASAHAARISEIVAAPTRIEATHGVVSRRIPRDAADRIRKALHEAGIASALVADVPANRPPLPARAESVSWDGRVFRLRIGNQSVPVPCSAPFLFVAASVEGETFIDLFVSPSSAFRIPRAETVAVTRVDVRRRSEEDADLGILARDLLLTRPSSGNEGLRLLAEGKDLGRLAFRSAVDYDDYLFWTYNLALSKSSSPGV